MKTAPAQYQGGFLFEVFAVAGRILECDGNDFCGTEPYAITGVLQRDVYESKLNEQNLSLRLSRATFACIAQPAPPMPYPTG